MKKFVEIIYSCSSMDNHSKILTKNLFDSVNSLVHTVKGKLGPHCPNKYSSWLSG